MNVDLAKRQQLVRRAMLINEMQILEEKGQKGWKLVGVGVLQLRFEPTAVHWNCA